MLSPDGKKIPTRGIGARRVKQEEARSLLEIKPHDACLARYFAVKFQHVRTNYYCGKSLINRCCMAYSIHEANNTYLQLHYNVLTARQPNEPSIWTPWRRRPWSPRSEVCRL